MFRGSLPKPALSIINEIIGSWSTDDVYIGCAGNFTIERGLAGADTEHELKLHGNDVTLYSCVIGSYLARQPFPLKLKPEHAGEYGWLEEYLEDQASQVATVMLCTRLLEGFGKKNDYYQRMERAYRAQWPKLHEKTREKVLAADLRLASFHAGDVVDWMEVIPDGAVCFPPFFAGDYENLFAKLDELLEWPKPTYPEMDADRRALLFRRMMAKEHWCFGTHQKLPDMDAHLQGKAQTTNRGVPIFIYGSRGKKRISVPAQRVEPVKIPRLERGMEIGNTMRLVSLTKGQFSSLRSQYMNINILPGAAVMPIGVVVDGYLVGVFAMNPPNGATNWGDQAPPELYLLSDFPVAPTDYPRLAKLVLYAALSKEAQRLAEALMRRRVRSILTTAFTKRPVSMKYRGLFELIKRKEKEIAVAEDASITEAYYGQGFELNYYARLGQWTLDEGLALWKKKHGQKQSAEPAEAG